MEEWKPKEIRAPSSWKGSKATASPKTPHLLSGIYSENARWEIQIEPRRAEQKTKLANHVDNPTKSKDGKRDNGLTVDCFQSFSLMRSFSPRMPSRKPLGACLRIPRNATASRCARRTPRRFRSRWHWRFLCQIHARTAYATRLRAAQARANSAHRSRHSRCQER